MSDSRGVAEVRRATESQRVASDRNQKIRDQRSRAKKFEKPISKGQPIYVKLIDPAKVEFTGKQRTTQRQDEQMKDSTVDRIRIKVLERLLHEGFVAYAYEELALNGDALPDDTVVLEIRLEKLRYGAQQHIAAISVRIYDLKDPTFVYGAYLDGGTVSKMSVRIARRFALSSDGTK